MIEAALPSGSVLDSFTLVLGCLLLTVVTVNAVAAIGQCILQFGVMLPRRSETTVAPKHDGRHRSAGKFVSVHVPTHNEPPHLVIATLEHLARLSGVMFEVLIIDNNTDDAAKWQPVAAAAARLGRRFRFFHFSDVEGAKAGALNLAMDLVDPRTTHVAIVDADYQVDVNFLSDALEAMVAHGVDYVQYPQAYRDVGSRAQGVERELGDYFACFAAAAGRSGSLLPTGTLSVFDVAALRRVGGRSGATITEDAEIGVRLYAAGYKGLWLARDGGTGLLPLDFDGLQKQRARWVAGNIQVLRDIWQRHRLPTARDAQLVILVQLTAWVSLWMVPAGALLIVAACPGMAAGAEIATIAAGTIIGSAILTCARMFLAMPGEERNWAVCRSALATKLALTWTAAMAWLPAVFGRPLVFHRTLKEFNALGTMRLGPLFATSLLFLTIDGVYAARGDAFAVLACGLLASIWPCSRLVDASLLASARQARAA